MHQDLRRSFRRPSFVRYPPEYLAEIILTTMRNRPHARYREGAVQRILSSLPVGAVGEEVMLNYLMRGFVLEEEEGTYEYYGA